MDITTPRSPSCGPGWRGPPYHRILYKDIRWRAQKCDYRVSAPLVQIGGCPAAQEAYPDLRRTLGSRTGRLPHMGFGEGGGKQRPSSRKVGVARAGRLHGTRVNAFSRGVASGARGSTGKPEQVLQHTECVLLVQNRPKSGECAVLGQMRCYVESWCAFYAMLGRLHTSSYPIMYRSGVLG